MKYACREAREKDNPYVYPSTVSQVFFVGDSVDPSWKVVLRHDPRSRRIEGDRDVHVFGASGSIRPTLSTASAGNGNATPHVPGTRNVIAEVGPGDVIRAAVQTEESPNDDTHLDDDEFEDEVELAYVE